jgi:NAD(P)-dependent dehydrogenase (short-subunit alcohol dehydrogenase family)
MDADLTALTCLITGATSGIGYETARALVGRGARVLIVARSPERGEPIRAKLAAAQPGARVDLLSADLSRQADVRHLAMAVQERTDRLDLLINNAGVITRTREITTDGLETQFAVNHLAPFLLTNLLLDLLRRSAPARVVTVASQVEAMGTIDLGDLQRERHYDPVGVYAQSKLANVLFTYELARRLQGTGVTANCLHPGVIATKLVDAYYNRTGPARLVSRLRFDGPKTGAASVMHVATASDLAAVSGRYFHEVTPRASSARSYDEALARELWIASARLTGLPAALA